MTKSIFTHISAGLIIALVLILHPADVEGLDLNQMKSIYANFFTGLEGIVQTIPQAMTEARTAYNSCAEAATTYQALVECAETAFDSYDHPLRFFLLTKSQEIIAVYNAFETALAEFNPELPEEQRGVLLSRALILVEEAENAAEDAEDAEEDDAARSRAAPAA